MALSDKHRIAIFRTLSPVIGDEEAQALLSQFPTSDLDRPATQDFVRAEIAQLESRISERLRQQTVWMSGAMVTGMGVAAGIASLFG